MKMDRKIYKSTRAYFIYLTVENVAGGDQRMDAKAACPPFPSVQARICFIYYFCNCRCSINNKLRMNSKLKEENGQCFKKIHCDIFVNRVYSFCLYLPMCRQMHHDENRLLRDTFRLCPSFEYYQKENVQLFLE